MKVYYFNTDPKKFRVQIGFNVKAWGHRIKKKPKEIFVTPIGFSKKNTSPKNLHHLKKDLNIEQIYMFDRIAGLNKNIFITDHINRSGVSFLRGKTPYKNLPMFPDMSKTYSSYKKKPGVVVHTLGPKNFKKPPSEKGVVFSESAAIFATLWRYIGVEVMCFGIGQPNETKSFLEFV